MTDEPNPFSDDVMKALRESAQARAPGAARARVAARLTTVGAGVLSGAASAAASSVKVTAGVASLSGLALSKTFGVGLALGVGTALAAYSVGPVTQHAKSQATRPPFASSAAVPARAAPRAMAPQTPEPAARPAVPDEAVPASPTPASPAAVNPTPELPRAPRASATETSAAPAEATRGLAEQQALLDSARSLLRTGDPAGALDAVHRHNASFPRTMFQEEREALAIRALVALGRVAEARARTDVFARRYGSSLALPALQKAIGTDRESVTEPSPPAQTPSEGSALR